MRATIWSSTVFVCFVVNYAPDPFHPKKEKGSMRSCFLSDYICLSIQCVCVCHCCQAIGGSFRPQRLKLQGERQDSSCMCITHHGFSASDKLSSIEHAVHITL